MKKTMMKWTATAAIAAGITAAPMMTHASANDNSHSEPSAQSLEQYDDGITEHTLIMQGARGGYVVAIQQELNDRGIATNVDGIYGPQTKHSVELFQNHLNLHVDGIVGMNTWDALNQDSSYPGMLFMEGDNSAYVSQIQQALDNEDIHTMVDGIYGPQTKANIMEYQTMNDLTVDGIVGPNTWNALLGASQTDHMSSKEIASSEDAIELLREEQNYGEDIVYSALNEEPEKDSQGSYYEIQVSSQELMEDGGSGTVNIFKVYQDGQYESTYEETK